MTHVLTFHHLNEATLARLADDLAFAMSPGDLVTLTGDLGAGKTTLARYLLRALAGDDQLEVPSPTFTIVQPYALPRFPVVHADLYRLTDEGEINELGIDAALNDGAVIVEWPERAPSLRAKSRLDITLGDANDPNLRDVTVSASGPITERMARMASIQTFLETTDWQGSDSRLRYLQGDASPRRYARVTRTNGDVAILMDWPKQPDGPPIRDGKPYSRIAHLAESVHAFVAVADTLNQGGLRAPRILAQDLDAGLLLIEDFGDAVFTTEFDRGHAQEPLWRRATDTLLALHTLPLPQADAVMGASQSSPTHRIPDIDTELLDIEVALLADWYWPALKTSAMPDAIRQDFYAAWRPLFNIVLAAPRVLMLRDYHSPNLIALDDAEAPRDIGIIDFQDAIRGPAAYDLVSLLQDARRNTSADIEQRLLTHYIAQVTEDDAKFDHDAFRVQYAILGAQRATKILGIFARLAKRDGKRQYLQHMPRIWGYLERNLAHPELASLAGWYDQHIPSKVRKAPLLI